MNKKTTIFILSLALAALSTPVFAALPPTANAGPDLYVNPGSSVILQGSGYDSQGSSLTYYWNCSGGTLSSLSVAQPSYTAPSTLSQATYNCSLTVTNTYGLSATDSVVVFVNYNNSGNTAFSVQTNVATGMSNNQATLNGYLNNGGSNTGNVWFQWGSDTNYSYSTSLQAFLSSGPFSQSLSNLSANTTYHYRAVAQNTNGTVYGQDATFNTGTSLTYASAQISKKVINLTSGNLNWQSSVNANYGDILSFAITIQPGSQNLNDVLVRDILPAGLIYKGNLTVNATLSSGNPESGINVGTIQANGIGIVSFQAQVVATSYGQTTITNTATVTSNEIGSQTASALVLVTNSTVSGATYLPTGTTNSPIKDSFFLPIALIILGSWLYFSGRIYAFADWLGAKIN